MTSNSHPSLNDRLLSPIEGSSLNMHPSTDASPDSAINEPHLTYAAANKIIKKLSPDTVENIFKFISGEEVMRTSDIARILSYFCWKEIMSARRVSKKWRDAAEMALPTSEFEVRSAGSYNTIRVMATSLPNFNTLRVMTTALPYLQQLKLSELGRGHKYCDGEDPDDEWAAETADDTTHDIDIISNFRRLQSLEIYDAPLNGIYPVLSNFPLLQKFTICNCELSNLKWNLDMLSGLPSLEELVVLQETTCDEYLSGNVRSLRVLKDTLEKVEINSCLEGNFMDLADFPHLRVLNLRDTDVTGDIRDICENDFPALGNLRLPESVRGGGCYKFHSITEVPSFMHAIHRLLQRLRQRNPDLLEDDWDDIWDAFGWSLSDQSPDWYDYDDGSEVPEPPFDLQIIQAGVRTGWSWCSDYGHSCEINWLDPEPSSESYDYEDYMEEMHRIQERIEFYKGYNKSPNAVEYRRLCGGLDQRV